MLPELTVAGLATFNGKHEIDGDPNADTALEQAALLVQSEIGVDEIDPLDLTASKLFTFAVYEVAGKTLVDLSFAEDRRRPIRSETIGQYTYVKENGSAAPVVTSYWLDRLRVHLYGIGTVR
jgi:hypothetical protein